MEPPPEDTPATSVPPLVRRDWDRRDEESLPLRHIPATPPPEDTFSSDSSNEGTPLLTEVHICSISITTIEYITFQISLSVARAEYFAIQECHVVREGCV